MGWWLIGAEVILILTACGACTGGLISVWCQNQRKSRCSTFSCCCGLVSCVRQIESDELILAEEAIEAGAAKAAAAAPAPAPAPRSRGNSIDNDEPPVSVRV